jgi:hypothetical protein
MQDEVQNLQQLMPGNVAAGAQLAVLALSTSPSPQATVSARSATPSSSLHWSPASLAPAHANPSTDAFTKQLDHEAAVLRQRLTESQGHVAEQRHKIVDLMVCFLFLLIALFVSSFRII